MGSLGIAHREMAANCMLPITLGASANGPVVDLAGYGAAMFVLAFGVATSGPDGTNSATFKIQSGTLANGSDMADIPAADYLTDSLKDDGTTWTRALDTAGQDSHTYRIGFRVGINRYFRLVYTRGGTFACPFGSVAILGEGRHQPV